MATVVQRRPYPPSLLSRIPLEGALGDKKLGKRTTSAATASGHEIPDAKAPAPAGQHVAVAKRGSARVASGGRAQPAKKKAKPKEKVRK